MTSPTVLVDLARPATGPIARNYDLITVVGASTVLALMAQFTLPTWPVPITGQSLGLLLVGGVLGSRRALLATLLYLAEGAMGMPVFQGFHGGLAYFSGPTAGYLLGFPLTAWLVGYLAEKGWDRNPLSLACALSIGLVPTFVLGCLVLRMLGFDALKVGLYPFIAPAAVKILLGSLTLPLAWKLLGSRRI